MARGDMAAGGLAARGDATDWAACRRWRGGVRAGDCAWTGGARGNRFAKKLATRGEMAAVRGEQSRQKKFL